jgi:peptide/nickel transport system ATP-binding protein
VQAKQRPRSGSWGLLPDKVGHVVQGNIFLEGEDLLRKSNREMQKIRGKKISMIFQDPMTALNPVKTVGDQIAEGGAAAQPLLESGSFDQGSGDAGPWSVSCRNATGDYPHQFSGGMRQRVMIAMALINEPQLLIADEPTTALDVTIQAQILALLAALQKKRDIGVLLISHDLAVVADICDHCAVMYAGEIVEYGTLEQVFDRPKHPYTRALYQSIPSLDKDVERLHVIPGLVPDPSNLPPYCSFCERCGEKKGVCSKYDTSIVEVEPGHLAKCLMYSPSWKEGRVMSDLIEVRNLKKYFSTPRGMLHAVDNVTFSIEKGKTIGVVGESGCGKSTLGQDADAPARSDERGSAVQR